MKTWLMIGGTLLLQSIVLASLIGGPALYYLIFQIKP